MAGLFTEHGHSGAGGIEKALQGKTAGIPNLVIVVVLVGLVWLVEERKSSASSTTTSGTAAPGTTGSPTPQQYAAEYSAANPTTPSSQAWWAGSANESPYSPGQTTSVGPAGQPTLSSVNPTTGPATGGGTAVITGSNLTGATGVMFGGQPAAFSVANESTIYATIPADQNASGGTSVELTVVTSGGSATGLSFAYQTGASSTHTPTTPGTGTGGTTGTTGHYGMGVVPTKQGTMIWLGTTGTTPNSFPGYQVGGGAPVYVGNATTLSLGWKANSDYYTPVAYAKFVSASQAG